MKGIGCANIKDLINRLDPSDVPLIIIFDNLFPEITQINDPQDTRL